MRVLAGNVAALNCSGAFVASVGPLIIESDLTMCEFTDSDAERALIDAARRGVTVRVLLDQQYHGATSNELLFEGLAKHKTQARWASSKVSITRQIAQVHVADEYVGTAALCRSVELFAKPARAYSRGSR